MHDVLAHRISLLSLHAGALEFRPDAPAEEVARAAGVIREQRPRRPAGPARGDRGAPRRGRPAATPPEPPQPTLADLPALVAESRAAGVRVERQRQRRRARRTVPAALGRAAYRIVQEGLTNARKHAPGAAVTVPTGRRAGRRADRRRPQPVAGRAQPAGAPDPGRRHRPGRPRRAGHPGRRPAGARAGRHAVTSGWPPGYRGRHDQPACRPRRRTGRAADPGPGADRRRRRAGPGRAVDDPRRRCRTCGWSARRPTAARCRRRSPRTRPDVVLMDIRMPRVDGLAATEALRAAAAPAGGDRADHLRRRRARAAGAARRGGRLPAQGHPAGGDRAGGPPGRGRRGDAVPDGDPAR